MTEITKELLDELKDSIEECGCGDGFCEQFGCSTVEPLLHFIDRQHEVLKATLQAVNDGHVDASEDYILNLSHLVRSVET